MRTIKWQGYEWITQERWGQVHPEKSHWWYDESCVSIDEKDNLHLKTKSNPKYFPELDVISNFSGNTSSDQKRPITNFLWGTNPTQPLISNTTNLSSFYDSRVPENQLITEGSVYYSNYSGFVTSTQTTSMFNTPFFVNAIQEGVSNFRNNDPYPYKAAAFLFLNSLPLATLREKYKTYENGTTTDLDYIFAMTVDMIIHLNH